MAWPSAILLLVFLLIARVAATPVSLVPQRSFVHSKVNAHAEEAIKAEETEKSVPKEPSTQTEPIGTTLETSPNNAASAPAVVAASSASLSPPSDDKFLSWAAHVAVDAAERYWADRERAVQYYSDFARYYNHPGSALPEEEDTEAPPAELPFQPFNFGPQPSYMRAPEPYWWPSYSYTPRTAPYFPTPYTYWHDDVAYLYSDPHTAGYFGLPVDASYFEPIAVPFGDRGSLQAKAQLQVPDKSRNGFFQALPGAPTSSHQSVLTSSGQPRTRLQDTVLGVGSRYEDNYNPYPPMTPQTRPMSNKRAFNFEEGMPAPDQSPFGGAQSQLFFSSGGATLPWANDAFSQPAFGWDGNPFGDAAARPVPVPYWSSAGLPAVPWAPPTPHLPPHAPHPYHDLTFWPRPQFPYPNNAFTPTSDGMQRYSPYSPGSPYAEAYAQALANQPLASVPGLGFFEGRDSETFDAGQPAASFAASATGPVRVTSAAPRVLPFNQQKSGWGWTDAEESEKNPSVEVQYATSYAQMMMQDPTPVRPPQPWAEASRMFGDDPNRPPQDLLLEKHLQRTIPGW